MNIDSDTDDDEVQVVEVQLEAEGGNTKITVCASSNIFAGQNQPTDQCPIVKDTEGQIKTCQAQVAIAGGGVDRGTAFDIAHFLSTLTYNQPLRNAKLDQASSGFGRFYAPIRNSHNGDSDPLCENTPENAARVEWLIEEVLDMAEKLGMLPRHRKFVRIKAVIYYPGCGIDWHPDNRCDRDNLLFWIRLVLSQGEAAEVKLMAMKVTKDHTFHPAKAFDLESIHTEGLAHLYAMSASGTGRNAALYTNKEETEALQIWHKVVPLPLGGEVRSALIIDLPLISKEAEMMFLENLEEMKIKFRKFEYQPDSKKKAKK